MKLKLVSAIIGVLSMMFAISGCSRDSAISTGDITSTRSAIEFIDDDFELAYNPLAGMRLDLSGDPMFLQYSSLDPYVTMELDEVLGGISLLFSYRDAQFHEEVFGELSSLIFSTYDAAEFLNAHANFFGPDFHVNAADLEIRDDVSPDLYVYSFNPVINGIELWWSSVNLAVERDTGIINFLLSNYNFRIRGMDAIPTLSEQDAIAIAREQFKVHGGVIVKNSAELLIGFNDNFDPILVWDVRGTFDPDLRDFDGIEWPDMVAMVIANGSNAGHLWQLFVQAE